jgi:hypothetical protein
MCQEHGSALAILLSACPTAWANLHHDTDLDLLVDNGRVFRRTMFSLSSS